MFFARFAFPDRAALLDVDDLAVGEHVLQRGVKFRARDIAADLERCMDGSQQRQRRRQRIALKNCLILARYIWILPGRADSDAEKAAAQGGVGILRIVAILHLPFFGRGFGSQFAVSGEIVSGRLALLRRPFVAKVILIAMNDEQRIGFIQQRVGIAGRFLWVIQVMDQERSRQLHIAFQLGVVAKIGGYGDLAMSEGPDNEVAVFVAVFAQAEKILDLRLQKDIVPAGYGENRVFICFAKGHGLPVAVAVRMAKPVIDKGIGQAGGVVGH